MPFHLTIGVSELKTQLAWVQFPTRAQTLATKTWVGVQLTARKDGNLAG